MAKESGESAFTTTSVFSGPCARADEIKNSPTIKKANATTDGADRVIPIAGDGRLSLISGGCEEMISLVLEISRWVFALGVAGGEP
jgi:hypothetical protein